MRLRGKTVEQLADYPIRVTCKDAVETIESIKYSTDGRDMTDRATEAEVAQMRSVVGSLGWIARQCRPDLSYHVSRLQGAVIKATVQHLKETNQALAQAQDYSSQGIIYKR